MTENIFEYINILLPRHRCITLPGFGAFILNKEDFDIKDGMERVCIPSCSITFNSRLQHDDGVLSSYLQGLKEISYDKASKDLANIIRQLRTTLLISKTIDCGSIGKIELIDSNIIFTQNKSYIAPQHYGLTAVGLKTITTISENIETEVKVVSLKRTIITVVASVAVILLLSLPSISITDDVSLSKDQQAGYLKSLVTTHTNSVETESNDLKPLIEEIKAEQITTIENIREDSKETPAIEKPTKANNNKSKRTYYIIVGGDATASLAERTLARFKSEGFTTAQIIASPQRHRISVESFDNLIDAEKHLQLFRKNNPKYETAWIHSRNN